MKASLYYSEGKRFHIYQDTAADHLSLVVEYEGQRLQMPEELWALTLSVMGSTVGLVR